MEYVSQETRSILWAFIQHIIHSERHFVMKSTAIFYNFGISFVFTHKSLKFWVQVLILHYITLFRAHVLSFFFFFDLFFYFKLCNEKLSSYMTWKFCFAQWWQNNDLVWLCCMHKGRQTCYWVQHTGHSVSINRLDIGWRKWI